MISSKTQSAGGKVTAIKLRNQAVEAYYEEPNKCVYCDKIIHVNDKKVSEVKRKRFCNKSCAAKHNNTIPKRECGRDFCKICEKEIGLKRGKLGQVLHRKFCDLCLKNKRASVQSGKNITDENLLIENQTKGYLFSNRKNWQSAASGIRKHSRKVFSDSSKDKICCICGYDKHVQISHIKPVSDFANDAKISEINDVNNLVALCPNHHWEFDHGLISKDKL